MPRKTKETKRNRRKSRRTTAETRRRMDEVLAMMAACVPHVKIRSQLSEKWGVKERTVDEYIDRVYNMWAMQGQDPNFVENQRGKLRFMWEMLFMQSGRLKQPNVQARCLENLGKLDNVYPKDEITVNGQFAVAGVQLGTLGFKSPQDVLERIDELRERLANGAPTVLGQLPPALEAEYAEWEDDEDED